jgi:hypothetical protein
MCSLLAGVANAQCPAGSTPLSVLVGSWTFSAEGVYPFSYAAAGTFTATGPTSVGSSKGTLKTTQSSQFNGNVIRFETDNGASEYLGYPDCSGVTLIFRSLNRPIEYDCWFQGARTVLYCVSIDLASPVVLHASRT